MRTFQDRKGREWTIDINVTTIELVKAKCDGLNLCELFGKDLTGLSALSSYPPRLIQVLWVLCEEAATKAEISPEEFGRGFAGDAIEWAFNALVEDVIDFFPNARTRAIYKEVLGKAKVAAETSLDQASEIAGAMTTEKILELARLSMSSGSATSSQASQE